MGMILSRRDSTIVARLKVPGSLDISNPWPETFEPDRVRVSSPFRAKRLFSTNPG